MKKYLFPFLLFGIACQPASDSGQSFSTGAIYEYSASEPRWISFENPTGTPGQGGIENNGAKGHPYDRVAAGESIRLLDINGPGVINRMWVTISDRSPKMLRGLVINMYWDGETKPAVSVPFGDFFGIGLGRTASYETALFSNPEGRSFNAYIQMPFQKAARVEVVNETEKDLDMIFYDIDLQLLDRWNPNFLYFHAYWQRDTATTPGIDVEILPLIKGKGRFLGTNFSINANPVYGTNWWGEGEAKIYLNGDGEFPTLVGTGTEDYIGTGWGQGSYFHSYQGCSVADQQNFQWSFYRYHIPDPIFFKSDFRMTIQQMGGSMLGEVTRMQEAGVPLLPVTINGEPKPLALYDPRKPVRLKEASLPDGWTNYYRSDDVAAVAYFYLDKPMNELPDIQPLAIRQWNLKTVTE
ncbi:MAG: DUF2961 domain-containing protein [Cyclobacteriaceae bacterium]|nr:DUF2961 domain-containing protein [Cyclobacteriaceae bacterium]